MRAREGKMKYLLIMQEYIDNIEITFTGGYAIAAILFIIAAILNTLIIYTLLDLICSIINK